MVGIQGRGEAHARDTISKHQANHRRESVYYFLFNKRSKMAKRQRMVDSCRVKFFQLCHEQWAKYMGSEVYFRGVGVNYVRYISIVDCGYRVILIKRKSSR